MPRRKPIQIACPEHHKLVRGTYACEPDGRYALGADGKFSLDLVECDQDDGRCAQTLCALHRYNRRGPGTWYPDSVYALPDRSAGAPEPQPDPDAGLF